MTNRPDSTGRSGGAGRPEDSGRLDKPGRDARNHRRAAARVRAQKARAQQKRRQRRTRVGVQVGLGMVLLAVVAVVTLVLVNSVQPAGPGPKNMADGGITIGRGLQAVSADTRSTPTGSASPGDTASSAPSDAASDTAASDGTASDTATSDASATDGAAASDTPTDEANTSDTVRITLYVDYLCPICGQFEQENSAYIRGLVNSGAATVQIHPISILANRSQGTKYSLRAGNAAACVANSSPDQFFAVNQAFFDAQPKENTKGLDDAALTAIVAKTKGITHLAAITRCIQDQEFAKWVDAETTKVTSDGIPNADVKDFSGTPTILVNGKKYDYSLPFSNAEFRTFVVTAAGSSFASGDDETPTPTPSASASTD